MTEVTETTQHKGPSTIAKAASLGMAALGSSAAGNSFAGNVVDHADHGHSLARWVGVSLSFAGFLIGGVMFPFAMLPAVIIGGALQVLAVIAVPVLNASGFGAHDRWSELKAQAAAERSAA
jgi:NADH:ubiquinone oxidoreductase subunit 6 (subunit J)